MAYHYFATLPSQRADMMQQSANNVQSKFSYVTSDEQANVSESLAASDYEFTENALVDKKVRCH